MKPPAAPEYEGRAPSVDVPFTVHREGDSYVVEGPPPRRRPWLDRRHRLKAQRTLSRKPEARESVVHERESWSFVQRLALGADIDADKVQARYENGVLVVTVPVVAGVRRTIPVAASGPAPAAIGTGGSTSGEHRRSKGRGRGFVDAMRNLPRAARDRLASHGTRRPASREPAIPVVSARRGPCP